LGLRNQSSDKQQTTDSLATGQGEKHAAHARQEAVNTMMASGGKKSDGARSPEPKTIDLTANPYEQAKAQIQTA
jgi:hypothetical protein